MLLSVYKAHPVHSVIEETLNLIWSFEIKEGSELDEAKQKVEYIAWCLDNSDPILLDEQTLQSINSGLNSLRRYITANSANHQQLIIQLNQTLKFLPNPRAKKVFKSDTHQVLKQVEFAREQVFEKLNQLNKKLEDFDDLSNEKLIQFAKLNDTALSDLEEKWDSLFQIQNNNIAGLFKETSEKIWSTNNSKRLKSHAKFLKQKKEFQSLFSDSKTRSNELEKFYDNKLALEAPKKYWSEKAKGHRKIAYWASGIFSLIISAGLALLIIFGWPMVTGNSH